VTQTAAVRSAHGDGELQIQRRGLVEYGAAWDEQRSLHAERMADERPDTVLLALVLSGFEKAMFKDCWRKDSPSLRFYLSRLADWGYVLSDVERLITGHGEQI
jgi:hypothetical protein